MKLLLSFGCCLFFGSLFSQQRIDVRKDINISAGNLLYTVGGHPFINTEFFEVTEGTPYFTEEWMNGMIGLYNNTIHKNLKIKLDLHKGFIHYLDESGNELVAESAVKEVILIDVIEDKNYRFINAPSITNENDKRKPQWFLWLLTGPATVYKVFTKEVTEQRPLNSATIEQQIATKEKYALEYNGTLFFIKKLKEVPAILANKKRELVLC